jgi:uncharacterized protein (TIGR02246 family)
MGNIPKKIMVVEDDREASTFMAEVLRLQGYEVMVINDSSKAIKMAESTIPHAFLLDLIMPQPDGFKLCKMLRAHPDFNNTPILIVTALNDTDSRIVAIGAGANDYLVKPFGMEELASKVKALLDEQSPTMKVSQEKEVRLLYLRLLDAWNRRSAADFAALFEEDGSQVGFDGSQVNGRSDIEAHLAQVFADHMTGRYVGKVRDARFLNPEIGILRAVAGMIPHGSKDINPDINAIQSLVVVKYGSQWRIALFQNTPAQFHGRPEAVNQLTQELRQLL